MKGVMNFDDAVISAVTGHMNDDHLEDSLLIAKAFGYPEATASVMVSLDAEAGIWRVTDSLGEHELRVNWVTGPITERAQVRSEAAKLYKAACDKLGVSPRREDAQAPNPHHHGGGSNPHHHGGGSNPHGAHGAPEELDGPKPFSQVIREASWGDHSDSEGAKFMEDIMRGVATKQDYIDLSVQHYFMYVALEEAAEQLSSNPAHEALHPADLARISSLEADLEFLIGADWRESISAVPATEAYVARIHEVGAEGWIPGIIAHHYTRYLGDLSGGQIISRRVSKQHEFTGEGVSFYNFEGLGDLNEFKNSYRSGLDALGESLDEAEQLRMVEEVRKAYAFNTAVFVDLMKQKAARA